MVASSVFAMAEDFYKEKDYVSALKLYQQFSSQFPQDPLAPIAQKRITEINTDLISTEEKDNRIQELMIKAMAAFQQSHFLEPDEDHAMMHINNVLQLDATHARALEMKEKIIDFYDEKASEATEKGHYETAKKHYENMLAIVPNDDYARQKINIVSNLISEAAKKEQERRKQEEERRKQDRLAKEQAQKMAAAEGEKERKKQERLAQEKAERKRQQAAAEAEAKKKQLALLQKKRNSENLDKPAQNNTPQATASNASAAIRSNQKANTDIAKIDHSTENLSLIKDLKKSPPHISAALLIKLLAYEQNIADSQKDLTIYVLGDSPVANQLQDGLGKTVGKATIKKVYGGKKLPREKPDVLYIGKTGNIYEAINYARLHKVLSVTGDPKWAIKGVSLGIAVGTDNKPKLLINANAQIAEGLNWKQNILNVATIIK